MKDLPYVTHYEELNTLAGDRVVRFLVHRHGRAKYCCFTKRPREELKKIARGVYKHIWVAA
jgi:hypothetical protein